MPFIARSHICTKLAIRSFLPCGGLYRTVLFVVGSFAPCDGFYCTGIFGIRSSVPYGGSYRTVFFTRGKVRLKSAAIRCGRERLMGERTNQFQLQSRTGRLTRAIDGELPQKHTIKIYNTLSSPEAFIMAQLRTGHNRLKSYLFCFSLAEDDQCECGAASDTVRHLLLTCEKW
jgi:hypothetical protein